LYHEQKSQFYSGYRKRRDGYVSLCPELEIASQGDTVEEATLNLEEAIELFFEHASETEVSSRL